MGAVGPQGICWINNEIVDRCEIPRSEIFAEALKQRTLLDQRQRLYRNTHPEVDIAGKQIILVDDGIATSATVHAALAALRQSKVKKVILAVPVAPLELQRDFSKKVDELIILHCPSPFHAVSEFYGIFNEVTDDDVVDALKKTDKFCPNDILAKQQIDISAWLR
jgi:predicted phosphoribosyltransferase